MANEGLLLPLPPPDLLGGVMGDLELMGGGVLNLDQQARGRLANLVWWVQYPALITHTDVRDPVKVIPAVIGTRVQAAPPAKTSKKCHFRDRVPYCSNCGGDSSDGSRISCIGFGELWKGCPCSRKTYLIKNYDTAPSQVLIDGWRSFYGRQKTEVTCLGGVNATQDLGLWSKLANKFCDSADMSKPAKKLDMTISDIENSGDYGKFQYYKYSFDWVPQPGPGCRPSCKEIFASMTKCADKDNSAMAKAGSAKTTCGDALYKIEDRTSPEPKLSCKQLSLGAPRGDKESAGATSVDRAIEDYCNANDGKEVKRGFSVFQRWGVAEFGVLNRSSFWLRTSVTCGDQNTLKMNKNDCKEALNKGMEHCDPGSGYTHGVTGSVGCMDYAIDLGGTTQEQNPPWTQQPGFPPPADLDGKKPECDASKYWSDRAISVFDLERAVDAWCVDGQEIKGFGKYHENSVQYPPKGKPQFYQDERTTMHISMLVETVNNGAKKPYSNMDWCNGYDWKMGREDCQYALRRLFNTCNVHFGKFVGGTYTYRCVNYMVLHTNEG